MRVVRCSGAVRCTRLASALRRRPHPPKRGLEDPLAATAAAPLGAARLTARGTSRRAATDTGRYARRRFRRLNRSWLLFARDQFLDRAGGICNVLASVAAVFGLRLVRSGRELIGSLLAVMIGGGVARTEPRNISR